MKTRVSAALLLSILLGLYSVDEYYQLFGRFSSWDDEGYVMLSLHRYIHQGQVLYNDIYSQYGPFYYLFHWFLHGTLHVPVSHDAVRWIFLGFSLALILACFRLVFFLTGGQVIAFLACIPFGWMLRQLSAEPAHPQGLVLILIAFVLISPSLIKWNGPRRSLIFGCIGAGVSSLGLVKPNIGGYLLLGILLAMFSMTPNGRWASRWRYLLAIGSFFLPAVLMKANLGERWAQKYALIAMATLAPVLLMLVRPPRRVEIKARDWEVFAASSFCTAVAILAVVMIGGTSVSNLILALILQPIQFGSYFSVPLQIDRLAFVWVALSMLLFAAYLLLDRLRIDLSMGQRVLGYSAEFGVKVPIDLLLQGLFGFATLFSAYFDAGSCWGVAPLFVWIGLIPRRSPYREAPVRYFARVLLVATAAFQFLHAYPVAGSQITWSLIWTIPIAAVCLHDACVGLLESLPWPASPRLSRVATLRKAATAVTVALAIMLIVHRTEPVKAIYTSGEPLALPGATHVRTDWLAAETYRWLTQNLKNQADTFVIMPGLDSVYLWTGKDPPGILSGGYWMMMIPDEQQRAVITELSRFSNVVAIRSKPGIDFWAKGRDLSQRPLVQYIDRNFQTIARVGDYQFMTPLGRKTVPLETNALLSFPMLQLPGIYVHQKPSLIQVDGRDVLLVSSSNEVGFTWPMESHRIAGTFGLFPETCGKKNVRSVQFTIRKRAPKSEVLLFERTLNSDAVEDRGTLAYEVTVPAVEKGTLILTTKDLSSLKLDDCAYWGDVAIN